MPEIIKISIIEDNPQYTQSLQTMISVSEQMECVASYDSGESYLESISKNGTEVVDVFLLDLQLPGKSGLQLMPVIRKEISKKLQIISRVVPNKSPPPIGIPKYSLSDMQKKKVGKTPLWLQKAEKEQIIWRKYWLKKI